MGKKSFIRNVGKTINHGAKSVGHVFTNTGNNISKGVGEVYHDITGGVSDVYGDVKGVVGYAGKHAINDMDNITNALSSPVLWIVVGGVVLVVLLNQK